MEETLWFIGSILVLAAVSNLAGFEQIDRDVDRLFKFRCSEISAQLMITKSKIDVRKDCIFWADISSIVFQAYIDIPNQCECIKKSFGEYVSFCQERALNLGYAIYEERNNKK